MSDSRFEVIGRKDLMIPMRDGVRLAANLFLPAREGKIAPGRFAAIVERTPYGKDYAARPEILAEVFPPAGYAVLIQDVRGRYGSEGEWRPFLDDGADAADLFSWIAAQPWSNGKIGMVGTSYCGGIQHAAALAEAPHLAALVPVDAMSSPGHHGVRYGGAFEMRWLNWVLTLGNPHIAVPELSLRPEVDSISAAHAVRRAAADPKDRAALAALPRQVREIASRLPFEGRAQAMSEAAPAYAGWLKDVLAHPVNDAFWAESGIDVSSHFEDYADIPVLHVTGAYDSWAGSVTAAFQGLSERLKSPQRLLFGPWTHGAQAFSFSGMAEFGPAAAIDLRAVERRWFDRWLKGEENRAESDPQIEVFVMGGGDGHRTEEGRAFVGGRWERASLWPPKGSRRTSYFLHAGGRLSTERPSAASPSSFRFDPSDPVPSIGGNVSSQGPLMRAGAFDQRMRKDLWPCRGEGPLTERPDVLTFETEPLDRPVEIFGPIIARLWVASDAPDTDFTAKLVDVWPPSRDFPDGVALNISDGIVRAMWRSGEEEPERLEPGLPVELVVSLYPTALRFEIGHRIRLDVSSSNFPRFDVNPNSGALAGENKGWRVAANTLFLDSKRPSVLILPVIERWD